MLGELRRKYRLLAAALTLVLLVASSLLLVSGASANSTLLYTSKADGLFAVAAWMSGGASQMVDLHTSFGVGGPTTNLIISMSSCDASGCTSFSQHGTIPNKAVTVKPGPPTETKVTLSVDTSQLPASSFENGGGPTGAVGVTWSALGGTPDIFTGTSRLVTGNITTQTSGRSERFSAGVTGTVYGTPLGLPSGRSITLLGINHQSTISIEKVK